MVPLPDTQSGEIRLSTSYEFGRKELLLRFDSSAYARAYQAKNPEGRILVENTKEVWLPLSDSMRALRSSDAYGMVIIFWSKEERRAWLDRTVLGEDIDTSDGDYGVRFKRNWSRNQIEMALDYSTSFQGNFQSPEDERVPYSRPGSRQDRHREREPYTALERTARFGDVDSPHNTRPAVPPWHS